MPYSFPGCCLGLFSFCSGWIISCISCRISLIFRPQAKKPTPFWRHRRYRVFLSVAQDDRNHLCCVPPHQSLCGLFCGCYFPRYIQYIYAACLPGASLYTLGDGDAGAEHLPALRLPEELYRSAKNQTDHINGNFNFIIDDN